MKIVIAFAIFMLSFASEALAIDRTNTVQGQAQGQAQGQKSTAQAWSKGGAVTNNISFQPTTSAPRSIIYDFSTQVPDAYAPGLAGGNPCGESASAANSLPGFSFALGFSWEGEGCGDRNITLLLDGIGQRHVAQVHACLHLDKVKETYEYMGFDCLGRPLALSK